MAQDKMYFCTITDSIWKSIPRCNHHCRGILFAQHFFFLYRKMIKKKLKLIANPFRPRPAPPRPDRNRCTRPSHPPSPADIACISTRWSRSLCTCCLRIRNNRRGTTCSSWRPCSGRTPDICSRRRTVPWTRRCNSLSSRLASADSAFRPRILSSKIYC